MNVQRELRLALGMRGGVSLAVWSGGACAEIDELRRSTPPDGDPFWSGLVEACGYSNVVVDVLAGTSAGGLNGVLFAGAIRHGCHAPVERDRGCASCMGPLVRGR